MFRAYCYLNRPGLLPFGLALVKMTSEPLDNREAAQDLLAGLVVLPGATGGGIEVFDGVMWKIS